MVRITMGIDCDDVLLSCNQLALSLLNEEKGANHTLDDIKNWNTCGHAVDERMKYFGTLDFFEKQKALPGAKQFIRALLDRGIDVMLITAVYPFAASQRFKTLQEEFPEIPAENIIVGKRKDVCQVDILLDDAPHNVFNSNARYPVLFRRPWNQHVSGMLSVEGYNECLALVDRILTGSFKSVGDTGPYVMCLVGPSGSGKTAIASDACKQHPNLFSIAQSTTTRARRENEPEDAYHFVSMETFLAMKSNGEFLETTMYAGKGYGMEKRNVDRIFEQGKNAIIPIDMCGAMAMKHRYGKQAVLCFVKRSKDMVLRSILDRNISNDDKYNRIISLDDEYRNEHLCDYVINNGGTISDAVGQLLRITQSADRQ